MPTDPLASLDTWPAPSPAAAVVQPGGVVARRGPGTEVRPWASVTKLVTALAVLVAVEEEVVSLDEAAGPPGATVRHLLAHASGLAPDAEEVVTAPGTRRIYSNAGYAVLGRHLAERAGVPSETYVREAVLEPLGMRATTPGHPAHGAAGPLEDLVRLAAELLRPTLLHPDTLAAATRVAFPGLDGVLPGFGQQRPNDWGLGPELRGAKAPHWTPTTASPRTFGHFGRSGSFVWVDPEVDVACAVLAGADFGDWAVRAWPVLGDAVRQAASPQGAC